MQIPLPLDPVNGSISGALAGFRLQRFEVLNWGTFDQRPWVLNLQGNTALLTGANGSGKSTLVDGLLTLLVPNKRRSYNQASSTTGKKERDEKSYVQGAYGRTRVEESYGSKPKLLREKATLSVLLAYFSDRATKQDVTLAQVLWMEDGSVQKFFVIANTELMIASHFTQSTRIADLKKQLKATGAETFDEFVNYSQQFRKRLGLQSEKALDLFNQTVSIKEIGGLNDFVRNHMLEKTDVQTKIRELQESYENLIISHTAIQKARKQLEALMPLTEEAEKYTRLKNEVVTLQEVQSVVPAFFASKKLNLLIQELQTVKQQLTQVQYQRTESNRILTDLRQQEQQLAIAISQDTVGQRIQELTRELEQRQKEVNNKKNQAEEYDRLAQRLDLPQSVDSTTFYTTRTKGEELKQDIDTALQTLEAQRDKQITLRSDLQKQQTKLDDELKSLRSRKSQIPKTNLDIRDRLAHDLNLDNAELPFIGELLQVRSEAKQWEGAIERLLRGFGLCVLVSEAHHQAVNTYVHRTHLRGRLVYYRVASVIPNSTQRALDPHQIPYKLEIKQENDTFSQWLRDQLMRQFNYVCCDVEQFQYETRAITQTGLTKHGGERHEKDDRFQIGDRSQYILGWSNASKIKALETDLEQVNQQLAQMEKEIQLLKRQRDQRLQQISWLQDFMKYTDFTEIDWRTTELDRLKLQEQKRQLEASSNRLMQLEAQLQTTRQEVTQAEQEQERLIRKIQTLEDRQRSAQSEQSQCEVKLRSVAAPAIEAFEKRMAVKLRQYTLMLETIAQDEANLRDYLQQKLRQQEQQQDTSRSTITIRMVNFKSAFPEVAIEMSATVDFLDEYLKLKAQIEKDDLPRHEQRFKQLMNEKVIIAISMFKSALEKQEEEIQQAIDELNDSLCQINYTDSTYIKLCCDTTLNREVRDFKEDLKVCLGDVARQNAKDNEELFQNIQSRMIERFKSEERWTGLVTDVRNWLDFSVSERYRSDNSEKEHHTDSSGKSGGQKVKLAYTILASAIAYQFGLNQDMAKSKSFRFVVIDEAFSKSDDNNARYAMELFRNLNLQLLVVTPKDKINVIESYISSLHFVSNVSVGDFSSIASVSIEDYRKNASLLLIKIVIDPAQIQRKAACRYPFFLSSFLTKKSCFPIEFSVGSLPKDYLVLREAVTQLISKSKQTLGYGYKLELESRKTHKHGQQSLPKHISIETEQDYLKLIKKEKEFSKFKVDVEIILTEVPELNQWLCQNPLKVIEYGDRWHDLLKVCQYFQRNPNPGLYIRELPIQVHTKFIEQNKGILRSLLENTLPIEQLPSVEGEKEYIFEKRFSLRYREPIIRFRILDQILKSRYGFPVFDISTPISEFRQLSLEPHCFFITENLMNFLTIPALENSLALFGSGYAIQALKSVAWLSRSPIFYWGDLDVDGFKILSQLRSYLPQTISIMMDVKTFETFQEFAVSVSGGFSDLPHLTAEEQTLYAHLSLHQKRLEQEHISQDYAARLLQTVVQQNTRAKQWGEHSTQILS